MKKIHKTFDTPLFGHEVHFVANCSFKVLDFEVRSRYAGLPVVIVDLDRSTKEIQDPWAFGKGFKVTDEHDQDATFWIWVRTVEWDLDTIGMISHEALHVTAEALKHTGIPFCTQTEEVYVYLQEEILTECLKHIDGNKK